MRQPTSSVKQLVEPFAEVVELPYKPTLKQELEALHTYVTTHDILVTDNYELGSNYQQQAKQHVKKLVAIDDQAIIHFYADVVLNHASPAMAARYDKEPYTQIYTGPSYLIARKAFRQAAQQPRTISQVHSLFICMGGADPYNITCKVLDAAINISFSRIVVVTGSAYPYHKELESRIAVSPQITWKSSVSADEMIELIKQCEVAVSTASSISLEICCVKSGLLIGTVAENQCNIHRCLVENECALTIGDFRQATTDDILLQLNQLQYIETINRQMNQQRLLIDGQSAERLQDLFYKLAHE